MNISNRLKRAFDTVIDKETDAEVKEELSYMNEYERNMFIEYCSARMGS